MTRTTSEPASTRAKTLPAEAEPDTDVDAAQAAQARLRHLGARVTQPRVAILACLIDADEPLTHQAVIDRLPPDGDVDRVTVYRVLDWLVDQGMAQKRAGRDRVFRFTLVEHEAARAQVHRQHSHFHCTRCDRTFCLESAGKSVAPRVPSGFAVEHVELTVNGVCAECGRVRDAGGQ
ncbi:MULTISPECIES: Fur family transcriptional regulator [unclassified Cupriavidus]|uniref:Fur family transcriptional regulator n=1 Tax=unclassified Cupriavidus TaxID=2640874 RepID=UPI0010F7FA5F|nr:MULTISPECIES: Fur family transcriptional regulator [unclassified Cupriavidus]MWL85958.1 transcriptional repressor [Cupriavidus sp. SW-Y-13]